jgi:hypothetical protein
MRGKHVPPASARPASATGQVPAFRAGAQDW